MVVEYPPRGASDGVTTMTFPSRPSQAGVRVALALLPALLLLPTARAGAPPLTRTFSAGAAAVDISPTQFPVNMPGGFSQNLAKGSNDPLHARALVLDDGKTVVALVLVDNLGVAREAGDEAKLLASRRCPILPENMLVSATHTH